MKKWKFTLLGVFLMANVVVCQAGMTVLDQTFWIKVQNHGQIIHESTSYSTGSVGYSYSDETLSAWATASVSSSNLDWTAHSTSATVIADPYYWYQTDAVYDFDIRTSISTTFQPQGNTFEIHTSIVDEWWGCRSYVELKDETTGESVYYADFFGGEYSSSGYLNTDHVYNLYVYSGVSLMNNQSGWTAPFLSTIGDTFFRVIPPVMPQDVTPIPAPGAMLLAGIGMSMIGWLRRRRVV